VRRNVRGWVRREALGGVVGLFGVFVTFCVIVREVRRELESNSVRLRN
jgi:hypothetical protein